MCHQVVDRLSQCLSVHPHSDISGYHPPSDLLVLVDLYFHLPAGAPLRKAIAGYVDVCVSVILGTDLLSLLAST